MKFLGSFTTLADRWRKRGREVYWFRSDEQGQAGCQTHHAVDAVSQHSTADLPAAVRNEEAGHFQLSTTVALV